MSSTMMQEQERREIEDVIEQASGQEWQKTVSQVKHLASGDRLSPHYRWVAEQVEQATKSASPQAKTYLNALPPGSKAAIFEVGASLSRLADFAGEEAAQEIASLVCQTVKQSAKQTPFGS